MPNGNNLGASGLLAHDFRAHLHIFEDCGDRYIFVDF
jgi:hypothetical protein